MTEAYDRGVAARMSGEAEPECPYHYDTQEYSDFASGFVEAKPLEIPEWYDDRQ